MQATNERWGLAIPQNPGSTPTWEPKCPKCKDTGEIGEYIGEAYCDCEIGREKAKNREEREESALQDRYERANVPSRFCEADLKDFADMPVETKDGLKAWLKTEMRPALYLWGDVGTGKTHLAAAIAFCLIKRRNAVRFIVTTELLLTIQESFGHKAKRERSNVWGEDRGEEPEDAEQLWDSVRTCDVLVLDDIATEYTTEWARARIFALINARYNAELTTIITTNLSPEQLAGRIGDRTVSRLMHGATVIHLTGKDRRVEA